jgi:hypothetical protein
MATRSLIAENKGIFIAEPILEQPTQTFIGIRVLARGVDMIELRRPSGFLGEPIATTGGARTIPRLFGCTSAVFPKQKWMTYSRRRKFKCKHLSRLAPRGTSIGLIDLFSATMPTSRKAMPTASQIFRPIYQTVSNKSELAAGAIVSYRDVAFGLSRRDIQVAVAFTKGLM